MKFRKKILIVTDNPGRLGNLMNRHGHLLAFAIEHNYVLVDYSFLNISPTFPRLNANLLQGTPNFRVGRTPSLFLKIGFRAFRLFHQWGSGVRRVTNGAVEFLAAQYPTTVKMEDDGFRASIGSAKIIFLSGYLFEARSLFAKHAAEIRSQFDFDEETKMQGRKYLSLLREPGVEIVGVHIRQTDFRTYVGGRWFYTAEQYARVMRWLVAQYSDRQLRFLVCSDERQTLDAFHGLDVHLHSSSYAADMFVLTRCDRLISTSSSFARAAAFLGRIPLLRIFDPDLPASHKFEEIEVLEEGWEWEGRMARVFARHASTTTAPTNPSQE
jgi:hypothetical protein